MTDPLQLARECGAFRFESKDRSDPPSYVRLNDDQLATLVDRVRAEAMREQREKDAAMCEQRAADVRKANTYRGRVSSAAEFVADQLEFAAFVVRKADAAIAQQEQEGTK